MRTLFFDTASNARWDFKDHDPLSPTQAYIIRLAITLYDTDIAPGEPMLEKCWLFKLPPNVLVQHGAAAFHGITDHVLDSFGIDPQPTMLRVLAVMTTADLLVTHSMAYRRRELERAFALAGETAPNWPEQFCVSVKGAAAVGLERHQPGGGYRFPSFNQCCDKFLGHQLKLSGDVIADGIERVRAVRTFYQAITEAGRT